MKEEFAKNMVIDSEYFEKHVGYKQKQDDLERCNCKNVGKPGHFDCGWNFVHNKPNYLIQR